MKVNNFFYNGLFVEIKSGYASYTAQFLSWTRDPGIAECSCSDGQKRLIPSCCLSNFKKGHFPPQEKPKKPVLFGAVSYS